MRIVKLNEQTRQDILASLLKRDPNHYSGYEEKVRFWNTPGNLTEWS